MMRPIAALGLTTAIGFAQVSCSPVQRIAENANAIRTEAAAIEDQTSDPTIKVRAQRIGSLASGIHQDLTQVEDKTPSWLSTLQWWGIAIVAVVVAFVLWNSGALTAIRIAVGWLPRRKREEAHFIEAVLDPNKPESTREYIAARRAADPELNAALAAKEK